MNYLKKIMQWLSLDRALSENRRMARIILDLRVKLDNEFHLRRQFEDELRQLEFAEDSARAQLMQLRVSQMSVRGRTGYSVCAFIPEGVLEKLRERGSAEGFEYLVASELVRRALSGAYHVNSRGAISAIIFEPLSQSSGLTPCGAVFDSGEILCANRKP